MLFRSSSTSSILLSISATSLIASAAPLPDAAHAAIRALQARSSGYTGSGVSGSGSTQTGSGSTATGSLYTSATTTAPAGSVSGSGSGSGSAPTSVSFWNRPDKPKFEGTVFQFVDMSDVTLYEVANDGTATTLAGQAERTYEYYKGGQTSGLVGDVLIVEEGIVAEAIGVVEENGVRGELFNVIACNVQDQSGQGDCIMVDYDGTSTKTTYSATLSGTTAAVSLGAATAVPAGLSQWAANALSVKVDTVGGAGAGSAGATTTAPGALSTTATTTSAYAQGTGGTGTGTSYVAPSSVPGAGSTGGSGSGSGAYATPTTSSSFNTGSVSTQSTGGSGAGTTSTTSYTKKRLA